MITNKELNKLRHPKEKLIFGLAALPIILGTLIFLGWWAISPDSMKDIVSANIIETEQYIANSKQEAIDAAAEEGRVLTKEEIAEESFSAEDAVWISQIRNNVLVPIVASPITPIAIILLSILAMAIMVGKVYGTNLGNGVKLSKKQFPEVYNMFEGMSQEVGLKKVPDIILINGNGTLNAFACTIPMIRNVIVIYSDIFEKCIATNDMQTLKFILGHELGHIKFSHTKWWYGLITLPLKFIPGVGHIFGKGLSRANEYSCDKLGSKLSGDTTGKSLMLLSAGKHNYQEVDMSKYIETQDKKNFWVMVSNFFVDHPITSWRILAVIKKHHGGIWFRKK